MVEANIRSSLILACCMFCQAFVLYVHGSGRIAPQSLKAPTVLAHQGQVHTFCLLDPVLCLPNMKEQIEDDPCKNLNQIALELG